MAKNVLTQNLSEPLGNATAAKVDIDNGDGNLAIDGSIGGEQVLASGTLQYTETHGMVPMLEGRSSVGRLGLFVHVTAGFGDIGFCGFWTLEISCIQPVRIYAGVGICQIFYHTISGSYDSYESGKYQRNSGIQPSMLWKDFVKE